MFRLFKNKLSESDTSIYKGKMMQIGFIVGSGRCGSTILASVLNAHSKICVPHELQILVNRGLYDKYYSGEAQKFTADDFIRFIRKRCPYHFEKYFDYISHFRGLLYPQKDLQSLLTELFDHICYETSKQVFLEQTPWYGLHLDELKELFPELRVIHLIRDGRDVAISYARTPWWTKDIMANLNRWEKEVNIIHEFCRNNPGNCIELKYEDLVVQPQVSLSKTLRIFDLYFEETMLNPEKLFDYISLFKGDGLVVQSDQYKQWDKERNSVFFNESIYGWKINKNVSFDVIPNEVKDTLDLFGYET
jgi:hypothetical protein